MENMTALMSAFIVAYHQNKKVRIVEDELVRSIFLEGEYEKIEASISEGIQFFLPNYEGNKQDALDYIVHNVLGTTVLNRKAFLIRSLENAIDLGCEQYVIYGSGYEMSCYYYDLNSFRLDLPDMMKDQKERVQRLGIDDHHVCYIGCDLSQESLKDIIIKNGYNLNTKSFHSMLGLSYYLYEDQFYYLVSQIASSMVEGSSLLFDFPSKVESKEARNNEILASGANEKMKSKYDIIELIQEFEKHHLYLYEYLDSKEAAKQFGLKEIQGVEYALFVKK